MIFIGINRLRNNSFLKIYPLNNLHEKERRCHNDIIYFDLLLLNLHKITYQKFHLFRENQKKEPHSYKIYRYEATLGFLTNDPTNMNHGG